VQFDADSAENNFLAIALSNDSKKWILAYLEPSTGETLVSHPLELSDLQEELKKRPIRHFLKRDGALDLVLGESVLIETLPENYINLEKAKNLLQAHYDLSNLDPFVQSPAGILALGHLVLYTLRSQRTTHLPHLRLPDALQQPKTMILGPSSAQHLDLPDLFKLINQTKTPLGSRQLKRWMQSPLKSVSEIQARQKGIQELSTLWPLDSQLTHTLAQIYDLERICARVNTRLAHPRDTLALGQSLAQLQPLSALLTNAQSEILIQLQKALTHLADTLHPLTTQILTTQREDPPLTAKDGGIFKSGTTPELDRLISLTEEGQKWLTELEMRERERTGISSLKVRYNRVFGYYLEVTQTHLKNVPPHYQRKQTMVGAERFFTDELKKFEEDILTASAKQKELEFELFEKLLETVRTHTLSIMEAARTLSHLDGLSSLAQLTQWTGWSFPSLDDSREVHIQAGRHPLIDQQNRCSFVPNDLSLSPLTRTLLLITGPNMGGKSTVMRQVALIIILGQMGAPVPVAQASWGVFSSVYTRIGAQDAITQGQSTFMVEMSELAHILHHADDRSLIILDEIGRGTSTYDGMSVAWATLEWICKEIGARTLFATHYHELVRLSQTLPLLANAHMAVENTKKQGRHQLRFLYELKEGPTNESFGIHVAQLAGLPKPVIQRAWKILSDLEQQHTPFTPQSQLSLFDQTKNQTSESSLIDSTHNPPPAEKHSALLALEQLNIEELTPLQALNFVSKLRDSLLNQK
jgi:DNA mismatch repair protein MutS